jgi:hypothetical protein
MAKVFVLLSGQYIQIRAAIAARMAVCELPPPNPNRFPKGIVSLNMTTVLAWTSLTSCMATSICLRYILQALRTPMMCAGIVRPRRSGRGNSATATTRFGYGMEQRIDCRSNVKQNPSHLAQTFIRFWNWNSSLFLLLDRGHRVRIVVEGVRRWEAR